MKSVRPSNTSWSVYNKKAIELYTGSVFFIRTSNFGAEAECSCIFFWRFEAENVLKMFLNYMVYTKRISVNSMRT